jgi:asparagine synthase (glutamine-hydrolysing)
MCGIAGLWSAPGPSGELTDRVLRMAATLESRGPDSSGVWCDEGSGLTLGHRRLSIRDLSPAGSQPMQSADGRWVLVYNGEIYNASALGQELEARGARFRGHSDTEVLLEAIAQFGPEATLPRLNGMFGFAVWDRRDRVLFLARDRMGIKPLYYGVCKGTLLFGSELRAIEAHPDFEGELDRDTVALYLRYGYVPAPHGIFRGIRKLPAGCFVRITDPLAAVEPVRWWDGRAVALEKSGQTSRRGETELVEELDCLLRDAVAIRMLSDVPLGAFLSGGVDSTAVVALMQAQSERPVQTFTMGFHEESFDEAPYARQVANDLGTDHTELYVSLDDARELVPRVHRRYDEPFADPSQIPTCMLCELARESVTVCLSGDGGDEFFGGYSRYGELLRTWDQVNRWPAPLRTAVAGAVSRVPDRVFDRAFAPLLPLLPRQPLYSPGASLQYRARTFGHRTAQSLYRGMLSRWEDVERLVPGSREPATILDDPDLAREFPDLHDRMQIMDTLSYLPEDILTKVDRASMAVGLEVRVPLLDHRVFELAWASAPRRLRPGAPAKWPLQDLLRRYVELPERPKHGFSAPIGGWLRGPLRDWAEDLLSERRLRDVLDPAPVREVWKRHLAGLDQDVQLWSVLMLQAWLADR